MNVLTPAILLSVALAAGSASGQTRGEIPQDTLAEVGARVITARDLIERIQLMPWQGKDKPRQHDSAKVKALQSMVAEQLLALEATEKGIGQDSLTQMRVKGLERLMVRDELFKREIKAKVTVSPQEIRQGLKRYASKLKILVIGTRSEADAERLSASLRQSKSMDSALSRYPLSFFTQKDSMTMEFGGLDTKLEDAAYALTLRNRVSGPVESPYFGWVVLYLVHGEANPEYGRRTLAERRHVVERMIRERKENQQVDQFRASVLASRMAQANPDAFELFARTILEVLVPDSLVYRKNGGYRLDFIIDSLTTRLWPHIGEEFVEMDGGGMTIGDVLEGYRNQQFLFPSLNAEDFRLRLNQSIKDIVAAEILAREGYQQKIHLSEAVRHDVGVWSNYWLARTLELNIVDSVRATDDDALNYLIEHGGMLGKDYEVNIREILVDSLRESLLLFERLNEGADMAEMARLHSKRPVWSERGGESGFFRVSAYPILGFHALEQDTGSVIGPLQVRNGYSLFKVLGKRTVGGDSTVSFDSLKAMARAYVEGRKRMGEVNRYVASLTKKYPVKFYYNRLPNVKILSANMVTRRFIGFGGVMTAVPMLKPLWEWVKEAQEPAEVLP